MLETPPTPPATLRMARRIGKEIGLRYVYTGNVHDPEGQSTYCHGCKAVLIGRLQDLLIHVATDLSHG